MNTNQVSLPNDLTATLHIGLSHPDQPLSPHLYGRFAPPDAKVIDIKLEAIILEEEPRELTPHELDTVAFRGSEIRLRSCSGDVVSHQAPNGEYFTVRQLLDSVEETERQTRDKTEWFGSVDLHHVYFEGISKARDGVWDIQWGS